MQEDTHRRILEAFLMVLRPMVKILLRCGIGFREFAEIAKIAFVDVASSEYGLRGRLTNISRVAVMTGLTRKEVRRVRNKISDGDQSTITKSTPLFEVLHRWHAESDFLGPNGQPAVLPYIGDTKSFSELVKRFGGDIPPGAMRTELKRIGAIEESEDGALKVIKRSVSPAGIEDRLIVSLVHGAYPLIATIAHNVNPDRDEETWPQITAFTQSVRESDLSRLRRISLDRLTNIAESFDDLFMAYETLHESDKREENEDENIVAVGVYYFEDKSPEKPW